MKQIIFLLAFSAMTDGRYLRSHQTMAQSGRYTQAPDANYDTVAKYATAFSDLEDGIVRESDGTAAEKAE
jgi:hypothetical protein